jgi:hypothetical protein
MGNAGGYRELTGLEKGHAGGYRDGLTGLEN